MVGPNWFPPWKRCRQLNADICAPQRNLTCISGSGWTIFWRPTFIIIVPVIVMKAVAVHAAAETGLLPSGRTWSSMRCGPIVSNTRRLSGRSNGPETRINASTWARTAACGGFDPWDVPFFCVILFRMRFSATMPNSGSNGGCSNSRRRHSAGQTGRCCSTPWSITL